MTLYLDTSDLVKLYIDEPGSDAVRDLVHQADVAVTSALAYPEARAAFARRRRERLLTAREQSAVVAQLDRDWPRFVTVPLGQDVALAAGRLASAHRLRGADAVHLATIEAVIARSDDGEVRVSSSDADLTRSARRLG